MEAPCSVKRIDFHKHGCFYAQNIIIRKRDEQMENRINMDLGWKFFKGDLAPHTNTEGWGGAKGKSFYFGAAGRNLEDSGWKDVDVPPHDFVMEGDYTQKKRGFVGSDRVPDMETIDSRHFAGGSLEGGIGWYRKNLNSRPLRRETCFSDL